MENSRWTWKPHIDDKGDAYWQGWCAGAALGCVWLWNDTPGVYHTGGSGKYETLESAKTAVERTWS